MSDRKDNLLVHWSVRMYGLLLCLYPTVFRLEYRESMTQLFQDQARVAWTRSSVAGLSTLWVRTVRDLVFSVPNAYWNERGNGLVRVALAAAILYVCTLAVTIGYSAVRFGEFYQRPAFSQYEARVQGVEAVNEDVLLAAYQQALRGDFGRYRAFSMSGTAMATVLLVLGTALFGLSQKSLLHGAFAFAGGTLVTVVALSTLPWIWFPLDQYPVSALWVMGILPLAAFGWAALTAVGRVAPRFLDRHKVASR